MPTYSEEAVSELLSGSSVFRTLKEADETV
jgi:hypothetical protein